MMKEIRVFYYSIIMLSSVGKNAASIQGRLLFFVFTKFVRLLIKGGFYSRKYGICFVMRYLYTGAFLREARVTMGCRKEPVALAARPSSYLQTP